MKEIAERLSTQASEQRRRDYRSMAQSVVPQMLLFSQRKFYVQTFQRSSRKIKLEYATKSCSQDAQHLHLPYVTFYTLLSSEERAKHRLQSCKHALPPSSCIQHGFSRPTWTAHALSRNEDYFHFKFTPNVRKWHVDRICFIL